MTQIFSDFVVIWLQSAHQGSRPTRPSLLQNSRRKSEKIISAIKSKNKKWVEREKWINPIPKRNQVRDAL